MIEVRVGQRGEIVIPKRLREQYGIKPNSTVMLQEGTNISIQPLTMKQELEEWNRRMAKYRTATRAEVENALKQEPYEDDQD